MIVNEAGAFNRNTLNKTLGLQEHGGLKSPNTVCVLALPSAFPVSGSEPGLLALKTTKLRLGDVQEISDAANTSDVGLVGACASC